MKETLIGNWFSDENSIKNCEFFRVMKYISKDLGFELKTFHLINFSESRKLVLEIEAIDKSVDFSIKNRHMGKVIGNEDGDMKLGKERLVVHTKPFIFGDDFRMYTNLMIDANKLIDIIGNLTIKEIPTLHNEF